MKKFWIVIRAKLDQPMEVLDERGKRVVDVHTHYRQNFGVTAPSRVAALTAIKAQLRANLATLEETEEVIENVDVDKLAKEIKRRATDHEKPGIWYQSGRMFFTAP